MRVCHITALLLTAYSTLPIIAQAKSQVYYSFPTKYLPSNPSEHPRIYIKGRVPALRTLYNISPQLLAVKAFQHDVDKLSFESTCRDWRCGNGWPAAAMALHWLVTGNKASGQKACDVYLPHFTGEASHTQETNLYYALTYDWLFHHPCFTEEKKADLRKKLIAWSDSTAATDEQISWIAHDTDMNISTTAGHFIAGLAILGEDRANGLKLLKRGWTGWKYGLNTRDDLPNFPFYKFFGTTTETGIPLPGWDYGMMSDVHMAQNLFYVLDELGVIDAEHTALKSWWANAITFFMHSVDPANTHYRWIGDQQSNVTLANGTGYVWSFLSNCVFFAERYGYTTEAALGRAFLDTLAHPSYGLSDGDTMLWFMSAWPNTAKRLDFKTKAKRYAIGGFGTKQNMGIGMFRTAWLSDASPSDTEQVTWGGFYGIGSYIADHQHNSAGSFWLWRNGEYLLTEPLNYGGNMVALHPLSLWNSLSIPNEAVTTEGRLADNGGPIVYFNQAPPYLKWGRAQEEEKIFYALLNADKSYNLPENIWRECAGVCRQPVSKYTRSFVYDGVSEVVFLVDRVDLSYAEPAGLRFRTQNQHTISTAVDSNTVSIPSDKGSYRALIRVLSPKTPDAWVMEQEPWASTVPRWQIDYAMVGSQARKTFASGLKHRIVTALHIGKATEGNATLEDAAPITAAASSVGGCALSFCFIAANSNTGLSTTVSYTTPATTPAKARHFVADLTAGQEGQCYTVKGSVSGVIADKVTASGNDHTVLFTVPDAGAQRITVSKCQ